MQNSVVVIDVIDIENVKFVSRIMLLMNCNEYLTYKRKCPVVEYFHVFHLLKLFLYVSDGFYTWQLFLSFIEKTLQKWGRKEIMAIMKTRIYKS